jgi:guanylate kinase
VHNTHRYGTPRRPIEAALAEGRTVLLEIDLQGARQVRAAEPSATLVFLLPPSWDELVLRLVGRGTEGDEERARRLRTAKGELAAQNEFDYRVVNDDVRSAVGRLVDLVTGAAAPGDRGADPGPAAPSARPATSRQE